MTGRSQQSRRKVLSSNAPEAGSAENRWAELRKAVFEAKTLSAELAALSRACDYHAHGRDKCPAHHVLTDVGAFIAWLMRDCPSDRLAAVASRLPDGDCGGGALEAAARRLLDVENKEILVVFWRSSPAEIRAGLNALRNIWRDMAKHDGVAPKHPLAPIVGAWQERRMPPDTSANAIAPQALFPEHHIRFVTDARDRAQESALEGDTSGQKQLLISDHETRAVMRAAPLQLADSVGLGAPQGGRGASVVKRLLVLAVLATRREDRFVKAGRVYCPLGITVRELARDWIWGEGYRRSKHGPVLRAALDVLHRAEVPMPIDGVMGSWRPLTVQRPPRREPGLNDLVELTVSFPIGCDHGPLVDRARLIAEGRVSDPRFNLCLGEYYYWDRAKERVKRNHRIYATRPVVKREPKTGYVLDVHGQKVKHKGKPTKDWNHYRAVRTGELERNPQASRVPLLSPIDLWSLAYGGRYEDASPAQRYRELSKVRAWLEAQEKRGEIVLERRGSRVRILECRPKTDHD